MSSESKQKRMDREEARELAGLCKRCTKPVAPGKKQCVTHLAKQSQHALRSYYRKKGVIQS